MEKGRRDAGGVERTGRGESHDQADAEWIVIRIRPSGGQPPAGPPAAQGLAALRAYFICFSYY
jgi:hypothetical protein